MSLRLPARHHDRLRIDTSLAIVNIVLLLIFFFLVAGQETRTPRDIRLAQTSQIAPSTLPSPILEIRSAKEWFLDGEAVSPELLPAALSGSDGILHLVIDKEAEASLLISALGHPELASREVRLVTLRAGPGQ
ncbi:ExbD/TolR family protein [Paracoccus methylarcula]|uniref:Biopolymer transporter ExbD n=1 Tax=Paracoccus methylarcula TaxID=72022 RepID=A0A3R7LHW0_9RHOB|nr:biopolymer transporter ExbD [Paracoccus methylarcula]RNF34458.1 biopolymer transporter ExbD [Paracoccus methylarcula]